MTEVFITNPYAGKINPGNQAGAKLYNTAIQKRDDSERLSAKVSTSKEFIDAMKKDATAFSWGLLTSQIEHASFAGEKKNILVNFADLDVQKVRAHMASTFYHKTDPIPDGYTANIMFDIDPGAHEADKKYFYDRVRANMIGHRIVNSLTKKAADSLMLKKKHFLWTATDGEEFYDGVTMLQVLITEVKPTSNVGVHGLKNKIKKCKLANYSNNVPEMLDAIEDIVQQIHDQNGSYDDRIYDTLEALLTSKNAEFCQFVQGLKDKYDIGDPITISEILEKSKAKYVNLRSSEKWNVNSNSDSKLVALTTQVKALKEELEKTKSSGGVALSTDGKKTKFEIPAWRLNKSLGDHVHKDGKDWWWCKHQHNKGKGMYVTHKPEEHTTWKDKQDARKKGKKTDDDSSSASNEKKKMTLSDTLKAAMVSKFKCSEADAAKFWDEVQSKQGN